MKALFGCVLCVWGISFAFGQTTNSFRSFQSGLWSDVNTWERFDGSAWVNPAPSAPLNTSAVITIRNGHNVTVAVSTNGDQITIESGGTLTINGGITFTVWSGSGDDLTINTGGTLTILDNGNFTIRNNTVPPPPAVALVRVHGTVNNAGLMANAAASTLFFEAGSVYNHLFTSSPGIIPTASWNISSMCRITGYTTNTAVPAGLAQSFGNFMWDTPTLEEGVFIDLEGSLTTVTGDLTFQNVPSSYVYLTSTADYSLNVGGNFLISNCFLGLNSTAIVTINVGGDALFTNNGDLNVTFNGITTLNVEGDLEFSGGNTNFTYGGAADIPITVGGDFRLSSSPIINNGGTGTYTLTFDGSGVQTYTASQDFTDFDYVIQNGSTVHVPNGSFFSGSGDFTLQAGATLGVASANGLVMGTTSGNIRVAGTRTYTANGNIVYNGSVAQNLGDEWGVSGDLNGVAVNLEIANTHPSGVTNNIIGSTSLVGDLTLTINPFHIGNSNTLVIQSNFNGNGGTIGGFPSSNLTFNGSGAINGSLEFASGAQILNNLTINRSGTIVLGTPLTINTTGTLAFPSSGNLRIDGQSLTVNGDITQTGAGALISNSSSDLIIGGTGPLSALPFCTSCGTMALNDVTLARTDGGTYTWNRAVTINGTFEINSGTLTHSSGITMADNSTILMSGGSLAGISPTAASDYNVHYTAAGTTGLEIPSASTALFDLTIDNSITLSSPVTVNGTFNVGAGGSLDVGTNDITMNGAIWDVDGSFVPGTETVIFNGSGTTLSGTSSFYNLEVTTGSAATLSSANTNIANELMVDGTLNHGNGTVTFSGSAGTITSASTVSFNNLVISGTLTAPTTMNVAGTFTSSGTFAHNGGTVVFNGNSSIAGTPIFHSITVTGLLSCPSPGTLTLQGDLRVNDSGNFNTVSGTVLFNGTANQRIDRTSGSAATIDFFNITIDKSSGTFNVFSTVSNTIFRLRNILTISQNGVSPTDIDFDGPSDNGTFLLRSTAARTARIDEVPPSVTVEGNISVERFVDNAEGLRDYRYFTSPVLGATVAHWQNAIPVIGRFSNPSSAPSRNTPSIYVYQETLGGLMDNRWAPYPNGSGPPFLNPASSYPLVNGRGYSVFVNTTGTPTLTVRGTLVTGDVAIPLTFTGSDPDAGYNLIGNPYPAPVDWDVVTRPAEVSPIINLKDNVGNAGLTAGQFIYYDATEPDNNIGNFTGVLASGQAFGVTVSGATSLTIRESDKTMTDVDPIVVRQGFAGRIKIRVEGNGRADETIIRLKNGATRGYDFGLDAVKLTNDYVNLYTFFDTPAGKLAINSISEFNCSETISIGVRKVEPGIHTFDFSDIESIDGDFNFILLDHFSGESLDLKTTSKYSFEVTADTLSFGDDRFKLVVSQENINTEVPVLAGENICLGQDGRIEILDSQMSVEYFAMKEGVKISDNYAGNGNTVDIHISPDFLAAGSNGIVVMGQMPGCNPIPMIQTATLQVEDIYTPFATGASNCGAGNVTLEAGGAPSGGDYLWYEKIDDIEPISGASGSTFTTPVLDKTKTYFVAIKNANGCEGDRVEVKAEIVHFEEVLISLSDQNTTLSSNYSEGNQWFFNNTIIESETSQNITPEESGIYRVEVIVDNCLTSAEREFLVTGITDPEDQVLIYPNPAKNVINVNTPSGKKAEIKIFDMLGKFLGEIRMHDNGKIMTGSFDLNDNPSGLYLVKIKSGRTTMNYKIIKE